MRHVAILLACLVSVSQGRRAQATSEQLQGHLLMESQEPLVVAYTDPSFQSLAEVEVSQTSKRLSAESISNSMTALKTLLQDPLRKKKNQLQLKYFDARGAAETARLLFALDGEEYIDTRYEIGPGMESPDFKAAKESGELKMNLNRAPVLVTEKGISIGQSKTIERFLARRFGLMGKNSIEEALIDSIAEHCRDVKDAQMRKGFSAFARGKTDEEKAMARSEWFSTDLPGLLGKIDDAVKETGSPGFAVGSSLSYADVVIFALLRDGPPSDKEDTAKAAEKCSALNLIADRVESHPSIAKWLENRPQSMF